MHRPGRPGSGVPRAYSNAGRERDRHRQRYRDHLPDRLLRQLRRVNQPNSDPRPRPRLGVHRLERRLRGDRRLHAYDERRPRRYGNVHADPHADRLGRGQWQGQGQGTGDLLPGDVHGYLCDGYGRDLDRHRCPWLRLWRLAGRVSRDDQGLPANHRRRHGGPSEVRQGPSSGAKDQRTEPIGPRLARGRRALVGHQ